MSGPKPLDIKERFFMKTMPEPNSGCWFWTGSINNKGYGWFSIKGTSGWSMKLAHRVAYQLFVGPIPSHLEIDHKCKVRMCVNPDHLEPVKHLENIRRGERATKTHCANGHPLSGDNLYRTPAGHRQCHICRAKQRAKRRKSCLM